MSIKVVLVVAVVILSSISHASENMLEAVKKGNIAMVNELLDKGEDPNQKHTIFNKPLIFFTQGLLHSNFDIMRLLLKRGADVNAVDRDRVSLLMQATQWGTPKSVKYLLEEGANPNHIDNDKSFPLGIAANRGDLEIVKLLVESGANVNMVTSGGLNFGYSALIRATITNSEKVAEYLLSQGADLSYRSPDGTALEIARTMRLDHLVKLYEQQQQAGKN